MDADLTEVEKLLSQADDAPTFGVNARELVLRAARRAAGASQNGRPAQTTGQVQHCSGETAEALLNALTVHEKPLVQYINRSAVPRIARQGLANRLAGQHMALLLEKAGLPISPAALQSAEAEPIRKAGAAAALAQELRIYRQSNSKQVYMNTAARTHACPSFLPASAAAEEEPASTPERQTPSASAPQQTEKPAGDDGQGSEDQQQLGGTEQQQRKKAKASHADGETDAGSTGEAGPAMVLQEQDIGWEDGDPGSSQAANTEDMKGTPGGKGAATAAVPAGAPQPARVSVSRGEEEEYSPSNSVDLDDFACLAREELVVGAASMSASAQAGGRMDVEDMRRAISRFVRAILDPLHQCKVISRNVYKQVAERAVEKILASHADAPDCSFLLTEASKVQRLVTDYIEHLRNHKQQAPK